MTGRIGGLACAALLLTAACDRAEEESYGLIATLGNDTTSVERITRTGDRIVSDAVGRSPVVMRRRWEATLAEDGSIRSWQMDTRIPNGQAVQSLHHEATFEEGRVRIVRQVGDSAANFNYEVRYPAVVPWNAFVYGTYEPLFAAARKLSDNTHIGIYFFEGWAEGKLGYATVQSLGGDSVALSSTGLAGSGVARLDSAGRLLSYSGEGTTYKQQVRRVASVPDLDEIERRFAADEKARGVNNRLSKPDTMRTRIGAAQVTVEYGRPLARGRQLFGALIPFDRVWRTGANEATHLRVSAPVLLGGIPLDSGAYTLWTIPGKDGVQLVVNSQTGQWGTGYQQRFDVARVPMQVDTVLSHVETFTIRVDSGGNPPPRLVMEWGSVRWSVPFSAGAAPAN